MSVVSRVNKKIASRGEDFLVNGTTPGKGFFSLMSTGQMHNYFDDTESMAITRPALILTTTADAAVDVSDTIDRDGRTYTIQKIIIERFSGSVVVKIAALV